MVKKPVGPSNASNYSTIKSQVITGFKGYAIVFIFLYHLLIQSGLNLSPETIRYIYLFRFAIVIFFFLSAYTVARSLLVRKFFIFIKYIDRRYVRLAIPYYFVLLLSVFLFKMVPISIETVINLIKHFLFLNLNPLENSFLGLEWTMPIQFWYYFLIPLFLLLSRTYVGMFIILLAAFVININNNYFSTNLSFFNRFGNFELYTIVYVMATILSVFQSGQRQYKNYIWISIIFLVACIYTIISIGRNQESLFDILFFLIIYVSIIWKQIFFNKKYALIISIALICSLILNFVIGVVNPIIFLTLWISAFFSFNNETIFHIFIFCNPVIQYLGTISYSLFLIHYLIKIQIFRIEFFTPLEHTLLTIVFTILIASVIYYLVEKPSHELSRRIKISNIS